MKFLRFVFGRFSIITLLVLLQVVGFFAFLVVFDSITPYYYAVNLAFSIIGILIVLLLISRNVNPNYIVPWIVIILLMPVPGVVTYLMFSQNRLRRKEKKLYRRLDFPEKYLKSTDAEDKIAATDKRAAGQSRYLLTASKLPAYECEACEYYENGETFFAALIAELRTAEKFIFMEYFIIEKGVMFDSILDILEQKVADGVEVRLMYDDIGSISTVGSRFYKKMRDKGINCVKFNKYLPIISAVHNNRDHRKITVVDGKTGFIGGANLADEYINAIEKYGYWKDSAVMVRGEAVKSISVMFLQMFNAQTKYSEDISRYLELENSDSQNPENSENSQDSQSSCERDGEAGVDKDCQGFIQPFADGPMPLYLEKVGQTAILNMINQAESYVYISTPYLIMDFQLTQSLKNAAKRGVDVRIITPHTPDNRLIFMMTRASYLSLIQAGVSIFEYTPGFMHSKNFLADGKIAIVGTMNMDYRSLVHHFECGVWMYATPCISALEKDFDDCFAVSHKIGEAESRLNPFQKLIKLVLELFAPLL